jgi:hypothetical protein
MVGRCTASAMCADAGLHADQARRQVGKPCLDLAARPLLPQHDRAARIEKNGKRTVLQDQGDHAGDLANCELPPAPQRTRNGFAGGSKDLITQM